MTADLLKICENLVLEKYGYRKMKFVMLYRIRNDIVIVADCRQSEANPSDFSRKKQLKIAFFHTLKFFFGIIELSKKCGILL